MVLNKEEAESDLYADVLFDNINCGVCIYRHYEDDSVVVNLANRVAFGILGIDIRQYVEKDGRLKPEGRACGMEQLQTFVPNLRKFVDERDWEYVRRMLASYKGGEPTLYEIRVRRLDGSYCWIEGNTVVSERREDERGFYRLMQASFQDISRRKASEEERQRLEEQIRRSAITATNRMNLLYKASCEVFSVSVISNLTRNKYWMLGDTRENALSVNGDGEYDDMHEMVLGYMPEEERAMFHEYFCRESLLRKFAQGESKVTMTHRMYDVSGALHWYQSIAVLTKMEDSDVYIVTLVRNIDDMVLLQKRSEKALVQAREEYQKNVRLKKDTDRTLEGAGVGLWSLEVHPDGRRLLRCNDSMKDILGFPANIDPQEAYTLLSDRIMPESRDDFAKYNEDLIAGKGETTYRWNHPTRGLTYMRCGGWHDFTETEFQLFRGYHADVTDVVHKEIEQREKLQNAVEEANRANTAKSEFLARMSHDIRTPINGILGMLEIEEHFRGDEEKQADCHTKIRASSSYLLSLINDVLDMSKLESGQIILAEEPIDMREILRSCKIVLEPQANDKGVALLGEPSLRLQHYNVLGSTLHIRQIFMNIVGNAIKYNKVGGNVNVDVREHVVNDDYIRYEVDITDTGIGMSPEFLEKVFEPFAQEHPGGRSQYMGAGLGLSIVKKMIDSMGGEIHVSSIQGEGSAFHLVLPLKRNKGTKKQTRTFTDKPEEVIAGKHILLAEDNDLNMEIALFMLENVGAIIDTAENGREVLDKFASSEVGTYDLVLMDVMMPEMSGLEATAAIRNLPRPDAKEVPIVAMTANAFAEDVKNCLEAGMNAHISKPLDTEMALRTMAGLLRSV